MSGTQDTRITTQYEITIVDILPYEPEGGTLKTTIPRHRSDGTSYPASQADGLHL